MRSLKLISIFLILCLSVGCPKPSAESQADGNSPNPTAQNEATTNADNPGTVDETSDADGDAAVGVEPADTVFTGGRVYTVNDGQPWAEAVAVKGNKIVFVGDVEGVKKHIGDGTQVIDTKGKTVMPGFVSAHDHLISSLWTSSGVQLFDQSTKEGYLKKIKEYAEANPDDKVIKGIGWSTGNYGYRPTAKELDEAVPDRPAIILDFTVHDAWLNTKAFEKANITKETPDDQPGVIYWVRDDEGKPTGCGIEGQWMEAYVAIGAWEPDKMMREASTKLFGIAAQNGTTTFLNPGIVTPNVKDTNGMMQEDMKAAYKMLSEMNEAGTLKLRTFAQPIFKNPKADTAQLIGFASDMRKMYGGDKLGVKSVKIHPEGNWNAEIAPFLEPYQSGKMGTFGIPPEKIKEIMVAAAKADLDIAIHSDSTGSARAAVDGILAAREVNPGVRHAIHHATFIHPDDQKRIIENKIPINSTPNFTNDWSNTDKDALRLLGEKRVAAIMGRYPEFARAGVSVSLSADVPSTPPTMQAPLFCVQGAVTLKDPSNPEAKHFPPNVDPMTVEQALRSITIEPAWQLRMEDKVGSLEVGKLADIVVLDANPLEVDKSEIAKIKVLATMMDGKFTHQVESK